MGVAGGRDGAMGVAVVIAAEAAVPVLISVV